MLQQQLAQAMTPEQQQLQLQLLQQHLLQQQQQQQQQGSPTGTPPPPLPPNMINTLQYQMLAFQFLQKTMGAPANDEPIPPVEEQRKQLGEKLVEAIYRQQQDHRTLSKVKFPDKPVKERLTFMDLLSGIQRSHAHASRQQRLLVPDEPLPPTMPFVAKTPKGLAPHTILQGREERIHYRAQQKQEELENKIITTSQGHTKKLGRWINENYQDTIQHATPDQIKDIIRLKSLRLREKQLKVRKEVLHGQEEAAKLSATVDKAAYRKLMKQSIRDAKMTEKLEKQQRLDKEKREKQRHLEYLQTICNHGRELLVWQKAYQAKMGKLGKAVVQFHAHIEREEQRRADRLSKERIRALKADDEEAYMKLIDEAKDTRLTLLLKQTGTYLESLTKAVVDQQNDPVHQVADDLLEGEEPDEETMLMDSAGNKMDYFRMAHRIQESVCQPDIMSGGRLKEYQIKGLQWMVSLYNNKLNGILADEMGLGKTIQTISLITYLIERKNQNGPFLVIVPLSTITNWELEFEKWAPTVTKIVYKGPPDVRKSIQKTQIKHRDFQVLLTTFDYIIKDRPTLSKIKWTYMIIDEGHRMKNTQSKLTSVLRQYYDARYRLILTGTPLQNNLPELWALLNFILPRIFNSVKSFEEWFNTPFSNQGVQDKVELNEEEQLLIIKRLHKVLRPFLLRRLKKDVESELPDKVERVVKCKLSALQSRLYWQMKKHGILFAGKSGGGGRTSIKGLNNTIMQLRKICNHPFVFEEVEREVNPYKMSNDLLYRTSGKFELLDRILPKLRATGHRVLIFFQMTQIMDIMEDFCIYRGYNHLRLDGSTKSDDRSRLLQVYNAPESPYFVFLLSTRAGGLGLNLQTADTVIIFDSDWNPHQDLQAQDRAHRIGQTKEVRIFRLITENSIEENILARAQYKLDIDGKVIQAGKFDHRSTEEDREAFLRSLLEDKSDEQDNENNEESEDLDDEELNLMLKRSDQEYATFAKMDLERQRALADEWRQRYGDNHPPDAKPERLMQEWELPEVYQYDPNEVDRVMNHQKDNNQEDPYLGRGQRVREHVQYDDGMTEGQWLRKLEREATASSSSTASTPRKRGMSPDGAMNGSGNASSSSNKKSKKIRMY
ncbi:SNF2 family N-terminal domain-containing protein [Phascolomyces articulosus]|uniref:SNF2 family N-terminal domain-containing protein n=1 Tax=Phascolomyces articulosus TaxID=60185 RepID=A0AAD5PEK3_9FUNG|nr:SNF2 family N-terminal domain-containing protein [Phascolomyces articulosus]